MSTFNIKKILVPIDFSEAGEKAIIQAIYMAKQNNASITLVHIVESMMESYDYSSLGLSKTFKLEFETILHNSLKEKMEELKDKINKQGIEDVDYFIEGGKVYKKVLELANSTKADIIIMGTHGVSGFKEFIMGSNTFRVVGGAKCPVLSIQQKSTKDGFSDILLPFRDKPHSRESVDYAISIAKMYDATIHILGINTDPDIEALKKIQYEAKQIEVILDKKGVKYTTDVLTGHYVSSLILSFAENKKADMIVMMADLDKMAITEYIVGPVAQQIVNHSKIPVLSIIPAFNPSTSNLQLIGDPTF